MSRVLCAVGCLIGVVQTTYGVSATIDVKVMSFNVWSADDTAVGRQRLIDTIRQSGADIVGFQEMTGSALTAIGTAMGYSFADQALGSEAVMSRYRIIGNTPNRYGTLIEFSPGTEAWIFNTHLFYAPYGPYQLNGIAYVNGPIYNPTLPASITSVVNDQIGARGAEIQTVLQSATDSGALASGQPVFLTGDFNEASHLDWTAAAAAAGVHAAAVPWPASLAAAARGFKDSYRQFYPNEVTHPGRTWSPVYPSTYLDPGDNPAVQPQPIPEPQDRIDFVYYAGAGVTVLDSKRSGPFGGDVIEELEIANYPSDHNAITSTFRVPILDTTRLTFAALGLGGTTIPAGYGSRVLSSPNVAMQLSAAGGLPNDRPAWKYFNNTIWPGGVANLDSGSGQQAIGATFSLLLTPDAGYGVSLDSFSLLDYDDSFGLGHFVRWELFNAGDGSSLASGFSNVPANGQSQVTTGFGPFFDGPVELRLTHVSGNNNDLAIDDIVFRQVLIPEPATVFLALVAVAVICLRRAR
jgi:exodeoxyribonuclease III